MSGSMPSAKRGPMRGSIVDANEGWRRDFADRLAVCAEVGVEVVEQPLPVGMDVMLEGLPRPVPVCADKSVTRPPTLPVLSGAMKL